MKLTGLLRMLKTLMFITTVASLTTMALLVLTTTSIPQTVRPGLSVSQSDHLVLQKVSLATDEEYAAPILKPVSRRNISKEEREERRRKNLIRIQDTNREWSRRNIVDVIGQLVNIPQEAAAKKIDWHNRSQIEAEKRQIGLGEQGQSAVSGSNQNKSELNLDQDMQSGLNEALSDQISLNRSLPDTRHPKCAKKLYFETLPSVTIVIAFFNAPMSVLLRTISSVIQRSPVQLLQEVILVDDASTQENLVNRLRDYIRSLQNVTMIHQPEREGLLAARMAGAKEATAEVLVFLDAHVEVNVNWLPPLLEMIALNSSAVVSPLVDVISPDTFEYRAQDNGSRGSFDWELHYNRVSLPEKDSQNLPEPYKTPTMQTGLFAISRKFFLDLGGYPSAQTWGAENIELSFKIWQCGGVLLEAPCSRVGHVYRKFDPYEEHLDIDLLAKNVGRVADVWMDEFSSYVYNRRPYYLLRDRGNWTEQKELKLQLKCKPFLWFMDQIATDVESRFTTVPPDDYAGGLIRPYTKPDLCVKAPGSPTSWHAEALGLGLDKCNASDPGQQFQITWRSTIKIKSTSFCWDVPDDTNVVIMSCHNMGGNQLWMYLPNKQTIVFTGSKTKKKLCLVLPKGTTKSLKVNDCNESLNQRWLIEHVDHERLSRWGHTLPNWCIRGD